MKLRWTLLVSRRHFRTKRREKGHTAGVLSVIGIAAGAMTLITVMAVMNGFQSGTISDILEINSYHLQVEGDDPQAIASRIEQVQGVRSAVPYAEVFGLAIGYFSDPMAVVLRSVPDRSLITDASLAGALDLVTGSLGLETPGGVVLGEELARRLGVRVGDAIRMVNFAPSDVAGRPEEGSLQVTGVFKSGFLEYDAGWGFVSLDTAAMRLANPGPTTVGVKLTDRFADRQVSARIDQLPGVASVTSWRETNRAIFGALRLEKTLMILLVGLIFVVVGVNIYQSLRRSVVERTEEIAVLKSVGAGPAELQLVFVLEGFWIGLLGGILGTMLGLLISLNINEVFAIAESLVNAVIAVLDWAARLLTPGASASGPGGFTIFSPAYFYLDEVPSQVQFSEAAGVFLFALLSATIAAYVASRRVSTIRPAEVLRDE